MYDDFKDLKRADQEGLLAKNLPNLNGSRDTKKESDYLSNFAFLGRDGMVTLIPSIDVLQMLVKMDGMFMRVNFL